MRWLALLAWGGAGCALAVLFLAMQQWTVNLINPARVKWSKRLAVGGAIVRWMIFSLVIMLALQHSIAATLVVFLTFLAARLIFLFAISQKPLSGFFHKT